MKKVEQAGLCTQCNGAVLIKPKLKYFYCPHCTNPVSSNEAVTHLDTLCSSPAKTGEIMKTCLDLERQHGPFVPIQILSVLEKHQPFNENVAFTLVRMSGYAQNVVSIYLSKFAQIKKEVPFASEFLDNVLKPEFTPMVNKLSEYIENKLPDNQKRRFKQQLADMKSAYVNRKEISTSGLILLYGYYAFGTVVNLILSACFMWVFNLQLVINIFILMFAFLLEIGMLFMHYKVYGNRLGIQKTERILLTIFSSSIIISIGSLVIGAVT